MLGASLAFTSDRDLQVLRKPHPADFSRSAAGRVSKERKRSDAFAQLIQEVEQEDGHHGIQQAQDQGSPNVEDKLLRQQGPGHDPVEELVENEEEEGQKSAQQRVVNIEADAHGGGEVTDQGFRDPEHA